MLYTVRYEAVNAMLLNEFLKEHRKLEEQEKTIAQLKWTIAQQMEAVTVRLKEQDAQIRRVSAQVELSKPAPRTVADNQ
jgi:septal ring factor EnvC (AmiA/AmiB activator)